MREVSFGSKVFYENYWESKGYKCIIKSNKPGLVNVYLFGKKMRIDNARIELIGVRYKYIFIPRVLYRLVKIYGKLNSLLRYKVKGE